MAEKNTRSTLGTTTTSADPAIQAYMDAKAASSQQQTNWDVVSDISGQILDASSRQREAVQLEEDNKRKELESYENEFSNNVNRITENAGGLGEEYFGIATEEAKKMQEEYMLAVRNGDKETQQKLKMRLQGLSTGVGSLKESLNIAAELKNDEELSAGRTDQEKLISATCTNPANITYKDGAWVWNNPKYNPEDPKSKEFFTQEDLDNSLGMIESETFMKIREFENSMNEAGMMYINGGEGASGFDAERIKVSIGDQFITQDNIMSLMHDDTRGTGASSTFVNNLRGYLDSVPDIYSTFKIDANGDGVFTPEDWDSEEDKKIIIDAITNKESQIIGKDGKIKKLYNYESSKNILAEYLTMHAEEKFYGGKHPSGKTLQERKAMRPDPGEDEKTFIKRGGIDGELAKDGTVWNEDLGRFITRESSKTGEELLAELNKKKS